jgi:hypothetical protein
MLEHLYLSPGEGAVWEMKYRGSVARSFQVERS